MINLKRIIKEVINNYLIENKNYFDDEPSIIDKYYKKKTPQVFDIPWRTKVHKNPKFLKFVVDYPVRAIGDINGNLYVAEKDGEFTHVAMGDDIGLDIWKNSEIYLRLVKGKGNNFYLSDGFTTSINDDTIFNALRNKHGPRFKFHDKVWNYGL